MTGTGTTCKIIGAYGRVQKAVRILHFLMFLSVLVGDSFCLFFFLAFPCLLQRFWFAGLCMLCLNVSYPVRWHGIALSSPYSTYWI